MNCLHSWSEIRCDRALSIVMSPLGCLDQDAMPDRTEQARRPAVENIGCAALSCIVVPLVAVWQSHARCACASGITDFCKAACDAQVQRISDWFEAYLPSSRSRRLPTIVEETDADLAGIMSSEDLSSYCPFKSREYSDLDEESPSTKEETEIEESASNESRKEELMFDDAGNDLCEG